MMPNGPHMPSARAIAAERVGFSTTTPR